MDSSSFELNLEQQFHIRMMESTVQEMSPEQMRDMLIQTTRLIMVKDNVIRGLLRSCGLPSTVL